MKDGCITSAGGETGAGDSSAVLRARRVTAKPVAAMAMNMPMAMSMSRTNPVAPADNVVEPVSKPKVNNGINHIPVSTAHVTLQSRPARGRSSLPPQAEPNVKEEEKQQPEAEMQALLTTQPSVNGLCTPPMKEFDAKMEEEEKPAESGIVATMCSRDGDNEIVFSKLEAERMEMDVVSAPVPALRGEENPATAIECMKDALSVIPVRCEEICTSAAAITMTGTKDSSTGTLRSAAEAVQKQEREQWSIDQPENKTNIATQAVSASVQPSPPPPPTSSQSPSSTAPTPRTQQPTKMGMEANLPQAKSIKGVGTAAATPSPDDTSKEKDQGNKGDDVADVKHGVVNKGCTSPAGEKVQQRSSIRPEPKHEKREAGGGESGDGPVSESTVDGVADVKSKSGDADVKSKSGDADVLNHSPPLEPLPSPPPSPPHPSPPVICSAISPTLDTASVPVPTAETTSAPPAQTTGPPAPVTTTQEAATSQVPAPESAAVAATVETAEASSHAAGDQQPDDVNNNLAISIEELTYYPPVWSDNDNDRRNDEDGGVGSVDKNEDEGEQSDDKENKVSSGNKRNKKKTPTTTRKRKRSRALTPPSWDGCVQEEGNEDEDDGEYNMDRDPEFRPSRKLRAAVRKYKARQQQEAQAKTTPPRRGRKRRGVRSRGSCSAGAGMVGAVTRNGAGKTVIAKTNASANEINEAATGTAVMETSGTKANGGQGSTPKDKTDGGRSQHL